MDEQGKKAEPLPEPVDPGAPLTPETAEAAPEPTTNTAPEEGVPGADPVQAPEPPAKTAEEPLETTEPTAETPEAPCVEPDPVQQMQEALAHFGARLDQHLDETASCSRSAFDRLYEEMRQYKDNFVAEVQRGMLTELLVLYDSITKVAGFVKSGQAVEPSAVLANLEGLAVEAEEILARRGYEPVVELSEKLNIRTQKAVRTVPTDDPDEDMLVVERVRKGFASGDRVFRKEEVVVKKHSPKAAKPPEARPDDAQKET